MEYVTRPKENSEDSQVSSLKDSMMNDCTTY